MHTPARYCLALLSVLVLAGCTGEGTLSEPAKTAASTPGSAPVIGGERPVQVRVPPGYQPGKPAPLLVMLHGYGSNATEGERYFRFAPVAAEAGMLYAVPEGTMDSRGKRFWNATAACCDRTGTNVDDSGYLFGVIREIERHYTVDPKRIFLVGISNGGFMSHRMACDHSDVVAAIASMAGAEPLPGSACRPTRTVAVLEIHGDQDSTVRYRGGAMSAPYPGAVRTVQDWAARNGCAPTARSGPARDLAEDADVYRPGTRPLTRAETRTTSYPDGCRPGGHVELWTITGGDHVPRLAPTYARQVVDFLLAHPKP